MYHLVGKGLKVPFWDRVQKKPVLKRYFDFFWIGFHAAAPDGVLLRYWRRYPSGSRGYEVCMARPNLELATRLDLARKKKSADQMLCASAGEPQRVLHAMAAMLPRQR